MPLAMNVNGLRVHIVSFCWITEAINAGGYGYITSSAPFFKLSRCSLILICHYRDVCPQQNKHRHRMTHKLLSVNRFFSTALFVRHVVTKWAHPEVRVSESFASIRICHSFCRLHPLAYIQQQQQQEQHFFQCLRWPTKENVAPK